jgi:hypothetical protein
MKHQIPSAKSQINFNSQNFKRDGFGHLVIENWSLSGIWNL